jgi:hypothetical protein
MIRLTTLIILALLVGCVPRSFDPVPRAASSLTAGTAVPTYWPGNGKQYRIRFNAKWQEGVDAHSFQGLMLLDCGARTARVVALSELGAKLFDISILPEREQTHSSLPGYGIARLREDTATGIRRTLLTYLPDAGDIRSALVYPATFTRCEQGLCLRNQMTDNARTAVSVTKDERELWSACFSAFRDVDTVAIPEKLTYFDNNRMKLPWKLQLILLSVTQGHTK